MRTLAALLLFGLPLLAEDPKEPAPPKKPDADKQLEELVDILAAELKGADPATRAEIAAELRRLLRGDARFTTLQMGFGPPGVKVRLGGQGGETMSGTWSEDGKSGSYTLKSLKDGVYELTATLPDKRIEDKGRLADLRKKYPFLGEFMVITPFAFGLDTGQVDLASLARKPGLVGISTRPPSEALRHHLELVAGSGLVVDTVLPGSRAEAMGLRRFDILLRIDGEVVEDRKQIKRLLKEGVTLEYIRRAKKKRLVTPAAGEPAGEK